MAMNRMNFVKFQTICFLITFIECTLAVSASSSSSDYINSSSSSMIDDRRLKFMRSLYESNPLGETELSDVWLILACALAWTVWLVSTYKQARVDVEPSIFDQQQSIQVTGNVLQVSLGEDADGTRIPVYLALIDYVVECYDPDDDTTKFIPESIQQHPSSPPREGKSSTEKFKKGVVLEPNSVSSNTDKHLQIRKCFYTKKLLEVGFANVKVLCLVDDPTTSELWDNYLHKKRQGKKPQNWMQLYTVYFIAVVLIAVSLYGGFRTVEHLPPDLSDAGYISLAVGALLLFPCALLLYHTYCFAQRWISARKGTIIHGSEQWHCTRMACGIHPIAEEADGDNSLQNNSSSITLQQRNHMKAVKSLEMPELHDPSKAEYAPPKPRPFWNARCAMNEYNVQTLHSNPSTVSSISSAGKSHATQGNELLTCQDPTSHLMEAFESMSAFGQSADMNELKPSKSSKSNPGSSLQKIGNLRRISSESKLPPRTSLLEVATMSSNFDHQCSDTSSDQDHITEIYSA